MKVLVIGEGGREHALCWKLGSSPLVGEVLCSPGNAGISQVARCIERHKSEDRVSAIVELAQREAVDLVVVGPEAELAAGLVDACRTASIAAFGPTASAARLEASKAFAKEVMTSAGVPTAAYSEHSDVEGALEAARSRDGRCVVKADGLAAGKGVVLCNGMNEAEKAIRACLEESRFGDAGATVVVEDLLVGEELSVLALCSGSALVPLVAAQDHKAVFNGDEGPNTGGMGAYAPAPLGDAALLEKIRSRVLEPTLRAMAERGTPLSGVLYAGLMICDGEPYVLEYNVRFGDPETQPLQTLLESDLAPLIAACSRGELTGNEELSWRQGATVCVVMASGGYPESYSKGIEIKGLERANAMDDVVVFHAGTRLDGNMVRTAGGRVLGVTAFGPDIAAAKARAYQAVEAIEFEGEHHRTDIADKALS
jgi:phosphoribosylamine--glycine ligase